MSNSDEHQPSVPQPSVPSPSMPQPTEPQPTEPQPNPPQPSMQQEDQSTYHMATFFHDKYLEGKMQLQHWLGLGHQPNVIPSGDPDIKGPHRIVFLSWHPVAGFAGQWFAEQTGLGKLITSTSNKLPDPSQHWGILVGDYAHQLWMDEHLDVIYTNEKIDPSIWKHSFEVGRTRFSDEALRRAAEMTIHGMRERQAAYNLISNNCQVFALRMLDAIQIGKHREFATSFEVYCAAVGPGAVVDLFKTQADELPPPEEERDGERLPEHVVQDAQKVMDENTTKLDEHHRIF